MNAWTIPRLKRIRDIIDIYLTLKSDTNLDEVVKNIETLTKLIKNNDLNLINDIWKEDDV